MSVLDPSSYINPDLNDDAVRSAFLNKDKIEEAKRRSELFLRRSELEDMVDEMTGDIQNSIQQAASNARDAVNKSNAWTSLANTGINMLGRIDFGGNETPDFAMENTNDFSPDDAITMGMDSSEANWLSASPNNFVETLIGDEIGPSTFGTFGP